MSDSKVTLATWVGGADVFIIDGQEFQRGVQREVTAAVAKRLEAEFPAQAVVVRTTAGSKDDERVPEYVVPPQPEEEPVEADWPAAEPTEDAEEEPAVLASSELDQHDETPHDDTPKDKE